MSAQYKENVWMMLLQKLTCIKRLAAEPRFCRPPLFEKSRVQCYVIRNNSFCRESVATRGACDVFLAIRKIDDSAATPKMTMMVGERRRNILPALTEDDVRQPQERCLLIWDFQFDSHLSVSCQFGLLAYYWIPSI